jgi:hypothetical protein
LAINSAAIASVSCGKSARIDPVTAYLGDKVDSHRTADVRAVMERLDKFGEETGIAILAVTHRRSKHKARPSIHLPDRWHSLPQAGFVSSRWRNRKPIGFSCWR